MKFPDIKKVRDKLGVISSCKLLATSLTRNSHTSHQMIRNAGDPPVYHVSR